MRSGLINNEKILKEVIEKNLNNIDIKYIELENESYYDIIILTKEENLSIKNLKCKYLLVDADLSISFINYIKSKIETMYILTFGSNQKSTITFSSIFLDDDIDYQICIQRSFMNLKNTQILQQEFSLQCINKNINNNNVLLICTLMLLMNSEVKKII